MASTVKHISNLEYNIFTLTPLFVAFYKNMPQLKYNFFLAYLLLPIVMHEPSCMELQQIKRNSRILRITDNSDIMAGFSERFYYYKDLTNQCLQYAFEAELMSIDMTNMSIKVNKTLRKTFSNPKFTNQLKIASQLFRIMRQDVRTIYVYFGIKQI